MYIACAIVLQTAEIVHVSARACATLDLNGGLVLALNPTLLNPRSMASSVLLHTPFLMSPMRNCHCKAWLHVYACYILAYPCLGPKYWGGGRRPHSQLWEGDRPFAPSCFAAPAHPCAQSLSTSEENVQHHFCKKQYPLTTPQSIHFTSSFSFRM